MIKFTKSTRTALMIAGGLLIGMPAFAQSAQSVVPYDDLDLSAPAGRVTLQGRINRAVTGVCGNPRTTSDAVFAREIRRCRADAMRGVAIQVAAVIDRSRRMAGLGAGLGGGVVVASR